MTKKRVLFVCMGNICRSPAAEGVFRSFVEERDAADRLEIDSAGTIGYHEGDPPDPRMRRAAANRGYRLESRARQFQRVDFDRFDLIVAMDQENVREILRLARNENDHRKVRLLGEFIPGGPPKPVPDPYYGGHEGFEHVLDMLEEASERLFEDLLDAE